MNPPSSPTNKFSFGKRRQKRKTCLKLQFYRIWCWLVHLLVPNFHWFLMAGEIQQRATEPTELRLTPPGSTHSLHVFQSGLCCRLPLRPWKPPEEANIKEGPGGCCCLVVKLVCETGEFPRWFWLMCSRMERSPCCICWCLHGLSFTLLLFSNGRWFQKVYGVIDEEDYW